MDSGSHITSELVKLERIGYREEEQLIGDCDQEGDGEVVVVERVDFCHDFPVRRWLSVSSRGLKSSSSGKWAS